MPDITSLDTFGTNPTVPEKDRIWSMKPLPKIVRIIEVLPFKITLLWNTSETRELDFVPLFGQWEAEGDRKMEALRDRDTFKQVAIFENRTLCWPNVLVPFTFRGETRTSSLELDALELYRQSKLV